MYVILQASGNNYFGILPYLVEMYADVKRILIFVGNMKFMGTAIPTATFYRRALLEP